MHIELPLEPLNPVLEDRLAKRTTSLCGSDWLATCQSCHIEEGDCCRNLEISLFPDEIVPFQQRDPEHVIHYIDDTYGYEKEVCCFLMADNRCELQVTGIKKPVDCQIYPLNYKNGQIYLDTTCRAQELLAMQEAKSILHKKIQKYPQYLMVDYEVLPTDLFIETISIEDQY